MEKQTPYSFVYSTETIGDVLISHVSRNEKEKYDVMEVLKDEKSLVEIRIPFDTRPVNAMLLIDNAVNALDYKI